MPCIGMIAETIDFFSNTTLLSKPSSFAALNAATSAGQSSCLPSPRAPKSTTRMSAADANATPYIKPSIEKKMCSLFCTLSLLAFVCDYYRQHHLFVSSVSSSSYLCLAHEVKSHHELSRRSLPTSPREMPDSHWHVSRSACAHDSTPQGCS